MVALQWTEPLSPALTSDLRSAVKNLEFNRLHFLSCLVCFRLFCRFLSACCTEASFTSRLALRVCVSVCVRLSVWGCVCVSRVECRCVCVCACVCECVCGGVCVCVCEPV